MKKFLKNEGFTLVELIVVVAILGILAAVAVPVYTGYVEKANDSVVETELAAIKTAADAIAAESSTTVEEIAVALTDNDDISIDVTMDADSANITDSVGGLGIYYEKSDSFVENMTKSASYQDGATWTAEKGWE